MSRIAADTSMPSSVSIGLRLISTGNSLPSLRRPKSSSPDPIGRTRGSAKKPPRWPSVSTAKTLGHQCLDWHAQEILARELEEPLCLRVEDDDLAFAVDDDDRVGRCLEKTSKPRFNLLSCSGVPNDADDERTRLGLQRAQADFDGKLAAILAAPGELSAVAHGTGAGLAKIVVPVARVVLSEPLGNQSIDLHAEQLLTGVTEQARGKLVDDDDVA